MKVIRDVSRVKSAVELAVTVATGVAAVLLIWRLVDTPSTAPRARSGAPEVEDISRSNLSLSIGNAPTLGAGGASVVMIEFSDFECPFCAKYSNETFDEIDGEFIRAGQVQYVVKHYPLEEIHRSALTAAQAAECAHSQGRFWDLRKALFANQRKLAQVSWSDLSTSVGLNPEAFERCMANLGSSTIVADLREGKRLGVVSTPTFFFGRRSADGAVQLRGRLCGAAPLSTFERALRDLVKS